MGPFIFFVLVLIVKSECVESDRSHTLSESDSAMCVCRPHVTINPPVCARSPLTISEIGCNSSIIQGIVSMEETVTRRKMDDLEAAVSGNQETVSSELEDIRRKMGELQVAVFTNQEIITSEQRNTTRLLKDTRRQVEELQVTVSGIHEIVTSEVRGIRGKLEELQVSLSALVEIHHNVSKDCSEILGRGASMSGVYTVQPRDSGDAFKVYCDMETDGGGWTVFQRRMDGSVDFYLDFANYSRGFGNLQGEFWLGNDNLHRLTAQGEYELRVDLADFENETRYAVYDSFSIADVSDNYRLTLGSYSGTAGDSLIYHNNMQFTTKDRDNDIHGSMNCAHFRHGAWWYTGCSYSSLNSAYLRGTTGSLKGVTWRLWKGSTYSLKTSEMKIRPFSQ